MTWTDLIQLAFFSLFFLKFWIAPRLVYSFSEAMARSLSMANTAISSAKVPVVDTGVVGRSAMYSRYNNGPRTETVLTCIGVQYAILYQRLVR
jgi:hypothetical protein